MFLGRFSGQLRPILRVLPNKGLLAVLGTISRIPDLLTPVLFGYLISNLSGANTGASPFVLAGAVAFVGLLSILISWVNHRVSIRSFTEQERRLKEIVWCNIQRLPVLVRDASSAGAWIQKLSRDVPVVQTTCRMVLETGVGFLFFFFGTFLLVIWKAPALSAVFAAVALIAIVTHGYFNRQIRTEAQQLRESCYREGEVVFGLMEMLPVLSAYKVAGLFKPLFESSVARTAVQQGAQQRRMTDFQTLLLAEIWGVRSVVLLACTFLFLENGIGVGDIVMYDMLIAQMLGGLSQVMFIIPQFDIGRECAEALREMLVTPSDADSAPIGVNAVTHSGRSEDADIAFRIEAVTFRYGPGLPAVIENFSTVLGRGEFICFLGRNGTGKSTLAKLLMGAYTPERGAIRSSDPTPAFVPQHIAIYRDTLLENIRLRDPSISEIDVAQTLNMCGLTGFANANPSGLWTGIGPGACSGGELRILGIARALVRNPRTLILDEITNSLDLVAKEAVYAILASLRRQCTIILITHDITCAELADRVFVFGRKGISEIDGLDAKSRAYEALKVIRQEW